VSFLLLTVQTRGGGTGRAGELVAVVLTPVQSLLVRVHRSALGFWVNYIDWKMVRREVVSLRGENEQLRVQALQAGETREENVRLRRLLVLRDRLPLATVAGEVIGREAGGWVRSLTVNRGRSDGIVQ
jgi:rod shape-determining protein MreC